MGIITREIGPTFRDRYIRYALDVATDRSLPDSRDGLKPVHRRILYSMEEMHLDYDKAHRKSARVVGDVLGRFHPHGDASVYDALVILSQDFSTRYPLIDGNGNFGSVDGDGAAAMRYTLSRLSKIGQYMLNGIKKNTVEFKPNYDGEDLEPEILPTLIPNLLINGTQGIAVGIATKIPPHNIRDVYNVLNYVIDCNLNEEETDIDKMIELIQCPDFPTGGTIIGREGAISGYKTGKGKITIRSKYEIIDDGKSEKIIITEIPYKVNKSSMISKMISMSRDEKSGKGEGVKKAIFPIKEVIDESDKDGLRISIELKKGESANLLINKLIKSDIGFQETFSMNMIVLRNGVPVEVTLKDLIDDFFNHAVTVFYNKAKYELEKIEKRLNIINGLIYLFQAEYEDGTKLLDVLLETIKVAENPIDAVLELGFNREQADHILKMELRALTRASVEKLYKEEERISADYRKYHDIVNIRECLLKALKEEFIILENEFGDERRTDISIDIDSIEEEDLIKDETLIVTYTSQGTIKAVEEKEYKSQKRGGKGVKATNTKDDEIIKFMFTVSSRDDILFFTNYGRCHILKAYKIDKLNKASKGKNIKNYLKLEEGEKIVSVLNTNIKNKDNDLLFITKLGRVKRLSLDKLSKKFTVTKVISFNEDDKLVSALLLEDGYNAIIATKNGQTLRIDPNSENKAIRSMGRDAAGVSGIKVAEGDEVIGMCHIKDGDSILTVTEKGLGKITKAEEWSVIGRGSKGVIGHKITSKSGSLVDISNINREEDEIFIASKDGLIVRIENLSSIRECSRSSTGVRIMNIAQDDSVSSLSINKKEQKEEES